MSTRNRKFVWFGFVLTLAFSLFAHGFADQAQSKHDHQAESRHDHQADIERNANTDKQLFAAAKGLLDLKKIKIKSQIDDLQIPAYVFQPLTIPQDKKLPALVWVYGGIHDHFGVNYFPFIKEAVEKGYIVIAPEYRGASGYGSDYYNAMDYGGYEVNDILSAATYLNENVPAVDSKRVGVIGWSHGGYIALLSVLREKNDFACVAAFVPVTNLVFRLSYKGPEYQRAFVESPRIGGLPHQKREIYIDRSPLYHVNSLSIPAMVQVATNDDDVDFVEVEMLVNALNSKKPDLSEIIVFKDPVGGHFFNRQVNLKTLEREDTPTQVESWNQTWRFLDQHLSPR